ncbi:MAG: glycosyltransferase family 4 protein [Flavobacterium sp.]|nr:glycosyltransferase family 4 protein [Flavobacterium sp.]
MKDKKLIRVTTVPVSLLKLLAGQCKFMSDYYNVIGVSSPGPHLDEVNKVEGIRVVEVPMTRTISPVTDLKSLIKMYQLFKREKPFIVHTHTPKAGVVGMFAAKLAGVPHRLHTVAGLPLLLVKGRKRKVLDLVEKFTYACATKVYPNSSGLYDIILENNYCEAQKLKVLANGSSNGIDLNYFDPQHFDEVQKQKLRTGLNIATTDFVFVFVGRMVGDKGVDLLVKAFEKLQQSYDDVKLLLVGSVEAKMDPLKAESYQSIETNKSIITVGNQRDVRPYFAISDALAFPSFREGFPNVVLQAGAMGLPSIVSNINGCNEIIVPQKNGVIVPVKSADALFEAMLEFRKDRSATQAMAANSREMIVSRYDRNVVWEAILQEYQNLENHV